MTKKLLEILSNSEDEQSLLIQARFDCGQTTFGLHNDPYTKIIREFKLKVEAVDIFEIRETDQRFAVFLDDVMILELPKHADYLFNHSKLLNSGSFSCIEAFVQSVELLIDFFTDLKSVFPADVEFDLKLVKTGLMYSIQDWKAELKRKYVTKLLRLRGDSFVTEIDLQNLVEVKRYFEAELYQKGLTLVSEVYEELSTSGALIQNHTGTSQQSQKMTFSSKIGNSGNKLQNSIQKQLFNPELNRTQYLDQSLKKTAKFISALENRSKRAQDTYFSGSKKKRNLGKNPTQELFEGDVESLRLKLGTKYGYLAKFKEKTLLFQLEESTDLAKATQILLLLAKRSSIAHDSITYGQFLTKVIIKFCDLKYQTDPLSSACRNSCLFHHNLGMFILSRCNQKSDLRLKTFYMLSDVILDCLKKALALAVRGDLRTGFEMELFSGLSNVVSFVDKISAAMGYPDFCLGFKERVDEVIVQFTNQSPRLMDMTKLPIEFRKFYEFLEVIIDGGC